MRLEKGFNFKHDYYKLGNDKFTTIRGRVQFDKFEKGDIVPIHKQGKIIFYAQIETKQLRTIKSLSLPFLKSDAEYPGFEIKCHHDFVDLLNSFLPSYYTQSTVDSIKTVFFLKKVVGENTLDYHFISQNVTKTTKEEIT